jgi:hypothetical protein
LIRRRRIFFTSAALVMTASTRIFEEQRGQIDGLPQRATRTAAAQAEDERGNRSEQKGSLLRTGSTEAVQLPAVFETADPIGAPDVPGNEESPPSRTRDGSSRQEASWESGCVDHVQAPSAREDAPRRDRDPLAAVRHRAEVGNQVQIAEHAFLHEEILREEPEGPEGIAPGSARGSAKRWKTSNRSRSSAPR